MVTCVPKKAYFQALISPSLRENSSIHLRSRWQVRPGTHHLSCCRFRGCTPGMPTPLPLENVQAQQSVENRVKSQSPSGCSSSVCSPEMMARGTQKKATIEQVPRIYNSLKPSIPSSDHCTAINSSLSYGFRETVRQG
jgi:hypothetical protein